MKPRCERLSVQDKGWRIRASKTYRQHLVSLVQDEHLHAVRLEEAALNHVLDTAGGTDDDVGAVLESLHVITNAGAANAGVALDVHEVTDGNNDLLDLLSKLTGGCEDQSLARLDVGVDLLQHGDREGGSLAGTRLGLGNDIVTCVAMVSDCRLQAGYVEVCLPLITGMMARCWIAEGRSKP